MEPYTLTRGFLPDDIIDGFSSVIWTERYYGDSDVELVVPATVDMIQKLQEGTFLGIDGSDEIMILETTDIQDNKLKVTGIALLPWLNNRFIRASAAHPDKYWYISGMPAGQVLWNIVYNMCVVGSPYLNGTINIGITNPQILAIPGLGLKDYDKSGDNVSVAVEYEAVYDALKKLATTYALGMQITLDAASDTSYSLGFRSYKGLDRSSAQSVNPIVRFSPQMDSLTNIHELRSIAALKTLVYAFAPSAPAAYLSVPGVSSLSGTQYTGFDLRAELLFADDISSDMLSGDKTKALVDILNSRAKDEMNKNHYIKAVDGEIVPTSQFKYGVDYALGDIIEVQGNSEIVSTARVTEYIRSQDNAGEKAYPTVTMLD